MKKGLLITSILILIIAAFGCSKHVSPTAITAVDTDTPTPTDTVPPGSTMTFTQTPLPTSTMTDTPIPGATSTNTPILVATSTNTIVPSGPGVRLASCTIVDTSDWMSVTTHTNNFNFSYANGGCTPTTMSSSSFQDGILQGTMNVFFDIEGNTMGAESRDASGVIVYTIDTVYVDNQMVESNRRDAAGVLQERRVPTYDANGRPIRVDIYDGVGTYLGAYTYTWDSAGRETNKSAYNGSTLIESTSTIYNAQGTVIRNDYYTLTYGSNYTIYYLDALGHYIYAISYDGSGTPQCTSYITCDSQGNILTLSSNDCLTVGNSTTNVYTYNSYGMPLTEYHESYSAPPFDSTWTVASTYVYEVY